MNQFFLIFVGGGIGSFCRFMLANWITGWLGPSFPFGTLTVNLVGCFLIGLIAGLPQASASLSPQTRLLLMTGFLGGLTTFSTYEYESFMLTTEGELSRAVINLGISMLLGFLAVGIGYILVRFLSQLLKGG